MNFENSPKTRTNTFAAPQKIQTQPPTLKRPCNFQVSLQGKFEKQFTSMEFAIREKDEIISQLQARIQELELGEGHLDSGDTTEAEGSIEEDPTEECEDHPFMRDGSVDTVLGARHCRRSTSSLDSASNRRSWEEHSEEETLELQDLPRSISPQKSWRDDVAIDLGSTSGESEDDDEEGAARGDQPNDWEVVREFHRYHGFSEYQTHFHLFNIISILVIVTMIYMILNKFFLCYLF